MNDTTLRSLTALMRTVDVYVLFSLPRSGSTTLCSRLDHLPSTSCLHELLNFHGNNTGALWWWHAVDSAGSGGAAPPSTDEARCAFVDDVRRRQAHPVTAFGFKLFAHHVDDPTRFLGLLERHSVRAPRAPGRRAGCVVLRRTNVTARYLSWMRAQSTGCWGTTPSEQRVHCRPWSGTVDARALEAFRSAETRWFTAVARACAGRPTVRVAFEDLTRAPIR